MPLRAVLFDAAGTLMHVREPVGVTYARIAHIHGVTASADRLEREFRTVLRSMSPMVFAGTSAADAMTHEREWWSEVVRRVFAALEPAARFDDYAAYFDAVFHHFAQPEAWVVTSEAPATLRELRQRQLKTGMVSNFDHRLLALLDGLGLAPLLDVVIRPADAGAAKPAARIFHAALERLQVAPNDALYVGDDEEDDVRGATAAGLHAVNVTTLPSFGALLDLLASW